MRFLRTVLTIVLILGSLHYAAAEVAEIKIKTKDLVYSAVTQKLYVSVPSDDRLYPNTVTAIDPATHKIGSSFPVYGNPGKMALSPDGRTLYVALESPASMVRIDLVAGTITPFSLEAGVHVEDMATPPNHPETVAIVRRGGIAVYDNGSLRPHTGGRGDRIVFGSSPDILYSCNQRGSMLFKNTLDRTGIVRSEDMPIEIPETYELKTDADRLYTVGGRVIDLRAGRIVGNCLGLNGWYSVAPEAADKRIFFLCGPLIKIFESKTFEMTGQLDIPQADHHGNPSSLVRWGKEGLAFRTEGSQVFVLTLSDFQPHAVPNAVRTVAPAIPANTVQLLPYQGDQYRYLVQAHEAALPAGFEQAGFNDSAWATGKGAFGSNEPGTGCPLAHTVQTSWRTFSDLLIRRHLSVSTAQTHLQICIAVDNQVARLFFNGREIPVRIYSRECAELDAFRVDVPAELVHAGDNLIAMQVRDDGVESYFDMRVLATQPTPGAPVAKTPPPTTGRPMVAISEYNLLHSWEPLAQTWHPNGPAPGMTIKSEMIVRNSGNRPSPPREFAVFLARERVVTPGDILVQRLQLPPVPPGQTVRLPLTVNLSVKPKPFGKFLVAQPTGKHNESAEEIRLLTTASAPILVPATMNGVWGVVQEITEGEGASRQRILEAEFTLTNKGPEESPRYGLDFYLSNGPSANGADLILERVLALPLHPGEHSVFKFRWRLPLGTASVGKYLVAIKNTNGVVMDVAPKDRIVVVGPIP